MTFHATRSSFGRSTTKGLIMSLCRIELSLYKTFLMSLLTWGYGIEVRLLDHGVCSGLLNLMAATYYYRLYAKAATFSKPPLAVQRFLHGRKWSPAFWWTGIVWATAATAIHNVQQMNTLTNVDASWPGQISLEEDPIAYREYLLIYWRNGIDIPSSRASIGNQYRAPRSSLGAELRRLSCDSKGP